MRRTGLPGDGLAALLSSPMALRGLSRSRPGVVDLREYRAACIAAFGLRAALDGASWLARVRIGYAFGGGLEVRAEACREPRGAEGWLVPAFLHGVPVRVVRAG